MSVCFICCRVFSGLNGEKDMWKHVSSYHLDKTPAPRHMCKICGRGFGNRLHLKRHIIYKHYQEGLSPCAHCARSFKTKRSLQIHLCLVHSTTLSGEKIVEKNHPCSICGVRFGIIEAAKRHYFYCKKNKASQGKTPVPDALKGELGPGRVCGSRKSVKPIDEFFASNELSVLDLIPRGPISRQKLDKSCMYCQQNFASIQSLKRHIQRKHPEKVEEANRLGKTYASIDSINLPYACLDCGRRLANRASLSLHRRRIHEVRKEHTCNYCYKSYPLGSELHKHMKRVHEAALDPEKIDRLQKIVLEYLATEEHDDSEDVERAHVEDSNANEAKPDSETLSGTTNVETLFPAADEQYIKDEQVS